MSTPDPVEVGMLGKLLAGMGVALSALGAWAWSHTHRRIEGVDKKVESKASTAEVDRHRDHIGKLFDKVEELGDRTEVRFSAIEARASDRHIELVNLIHTLKK